MIKFTIASKADIPTVLELYAAASGTPGCTWNEYYPSMREVSFDIAHGYLYLMYLDGRPVGAATIGDLGDYTDAPWAQYPDSCELARVAVAPEYSGRALASKLVAEMLSEAAARGWRSVRLLAAIQNPAAIALYEHFGFERRAAVVDWGNDYYAYERRLERN